MSSLSDLRAGDIGFGPIHGGVGAGVGAGQLLLAAGERGWVWRTGVKDWWRKRHVLVVTSAPVYSAGEMAGPMAVQAMPGGAEYVQLRPETHWTSEWTFIRPAYRHPEVGYAVADAARGYVGTPYDFLTYPAIPLWRRGVRTERIKKIVSGTDTMMCSRLADAALRDAGWHVFDDGRLPGNVTPSELYRALRVQGGATIFTSV